MVRHRQEQTPSCPNNTKATVTIEATLPYGDGGTKNLKNSWSFPITIDNEDPHASDLKVTEAEGRYYLSLDVSDNQYVSAIVFYNLRNSICCTGSRASPRLRRASPATSRSMTSPVWARPSA